MVGQCSPGLGSAELIRLMKVGIWGCWGRLFERQPSAYNKEFGDGNCWSCSSHQFQIRQLVNGLNASSDYNIQTGTYFRAPEEGWDAELNYSSEIWSNS